MRILLVQDSDWLIRGPHQQHHLMEKLMLRGHEIRVIDYEILWRTQGKEELYSKRQVFGNISKIYEGAKVMLIRPGIIKIPYLDYISLSFTQSGEIERQIREFSPDVIVGLGILSSYLAVKAAKRDVIPFVYYWIDLLHTLIPFKPLQPIGRILESITLKQADMVLAINEELKNCLLGLGAMPERTYVLRTGINIEQFRPSDKKGGVIRKQCGFKPDDIILFFMGWLYHFSGLKEVALRLAEIDDNRLKLLIVGEGDAYEELQQIQNRYNLQGRLILAGKKPYSEISAFIAASDICLLPAYPTEKIMQDIVPIKMYEYMSMAKPVISTRLPGILKEFGEDSGIVYVDRSADAVEKAIELVRDSSLGGLGAKARGFVERYSWDNITDEFDEILQGIIRRRRG